MKWVYNDYRPDGFESWSAMWGKPTNKNKCELVVAKIGENRYTVWWYSKGITDVKTHIDAESWDDAKTTAIAIVQNTLNGRAGYWRDMADYFAKWTEVIEHETV